jgi:hypothetical protein
MGISMGKLLVLTAEQGGRELAMGRNYDRQIWSGLSWAVAEISPQELVPGSPVRVTYSITDPKAGSGIASISAFAVLN